MGNSPSKNRVEINASKPNWKEIISMDNLQAKNKIKIDAK